MDQPEVKLHFTAAAEGLENVFKQIQEISKASNIKLDDKFREQMKDVETRLPGFLQTMREEMEKANISPINIAILQKDFKTINTMLDNMLSALGKMNLPSAIQQQVDTVSQKIKEWSKELDSIDKKLKTQGKKLDSSRESGLSRDTENKALKAEKITIPDLGDQTFGGDLQSYTEAYKELQEAGKLTAEMEKEHAQVMESATKAINKTKTAIEAEIAALRAKQSTLRENINTESAHLTALKDEAASNSSLSEIEQENTQKLIKARQDLNIANQEELASKSAARDQTVSNTAAINENTTAQQQNTNSVVKAAKQVFTYGTLLRAFRKIYSTVTSTVKDLDKALTSMSIVTNLSRQQAYALTGQMQDLARATGSTTTAVASTVTMYLQQGKSISQAMELTEAATRAATIAGIDQTTSVNLLTNAMNGFQLSASHAMETSDKFAALAASAATNYEELATALSKVASQANLAGLSMDFTLGLLTKGIETTREAPETIGTALKTVLSRMRELTDYGKTLEDNVDVNRVAKALSNINIEMMDAEGQFRDMESVLKEVGAAWSSLTKNQQANIAVAMAGTRQQSRFIAMMQNFDRTLELTDISANSYGATMAQSMKYTEGLEAAQNRLTTAVQSVVNAFQSSDFIIGLIDTLGNVIQFISENTYLLIPVVALLAISALNILTTKMEEAALTKLQLQQEREKQAEKLKAQINELKFGKNLSQVELKRAEISEKAAKKKLNDEKKLTNQVKIQGLEKDKQIAKEAGNLAEVARIEGEINSLNIENTELDAENVRLTAEQETLTAEINALSVEDNLTEDEKLQLQQKQLALMGLQANQQGILGKITGSMIGVLTTINALKQVGLMLSKKEGAQEAKNTAEKKKGFIAKLQAAGAQMAESAASIPVAGWIIAAAILAAIVGISIAIAAASKSDKETAADSIDKTREKLNKLQADLYNLDKGIATVGKLADEFENLSGKIVKSTEDLERLEEIAQQINDEAGRQIVDTSDSYENQLAAIKGYKMTQEVHRQNKVNDINKELGQGLKDAKAAAGWKTAGKIVLGTLVGGIPGAAIAGGAIATADKAQKTAEEEYYKALKTDAAFTASLRTVALNSIDELKTATKETQDTITKTMIGVIDQSNIFGDEGLNTDAFVEYMNNALQNTDIGSFGQLVGALDATANVTENHLTAYANLYESLSGMGDKAKESLLKANPLLKAMSELEKVTGQRASTIAKNFDKIGYSTEQVNDLFTRLGKAEKVLGDQATKNFGLMLASIQSAGDEMSIQEKAAAKRQIAQEMYQMELQATLEAQQGVALATDKNATDQQIAQNEVAQNYKRNLDKIEELQDEADYKAIIKKQEKGKKLSKEEEKKLAEYEKQMGAAQAENDKYEELANRSYAEIFSTYVDTLGQLTSTEVTDTLTKLGSQMERLIKITDMASMSLKDQLELFNDYPDAYEAMQKGYLSVTDGIKLGTDKLKNTTDQLKEDIISVGEVFKTAGADFLLENGQLSEQATSDLLSGKYDYTAKNADGNDNALVAAIKKKLTDEAKAQDKTLSKSELEESTRKMIGTLKDQAQLQRNNIFMLDQIAKQGAAVLLSDAQKEAWANATSIIKANDAWINQLKDDLEGLNETDADYIKKQSEYKSRLIDGIQQYANEANKVYGEIADAIKDSSLNMDNIDIVDGKAFFKNIDRATEEEKNALALVNAGFQDRAEQIKEYYEQRKKYAEELANIEIGNAKKVLEAQKEVLEKRKEAYQEYFDLIDSHEEAEERAASMEDLSKQIAALSGGSDAATKALRKDLISQMEDLKKEEKEARKEEMRNALLEGIDKEIETLEQNITNLEDSVNNLRQAFEEGKLVNVAVDNNGNVSINYSSPIPKNAEGGLVDYTGLAWVDGSKTKPEAFLSATDTVNIASLAEALRNSINLGNLNASDIVDGSAQISIENINISTQHLDDNQDFRAAGASLAEEFEKAIRQRGISVNVRK